MTELVIAASVVGFCVGLVRRNAASYRWLVAYLAPVIGTASIVGLEGVGLRLEQVIIGIAAAFIGLAVESLVEHTLSAPITLRR